MDIRSTSTVNRRDDAEVGLGKRRGDTYGRGGWGRCVERWRDGGMEGRGC